MDRPSHDPNFAALRIENFKFLQPTQQEELRRVGMAPLEVVRKVADEDLTLVDPNRTGSIVIPQTRIDAWKRAQRPPTAPGVAVIERNDRPATGDETESNPSQEN